MESNRCHKAGVNFHLGSQESNFTETTLCDSMREIDSHNLDLTSITARIDSVIPVESGP